MIRIEHLPADVLDLSPLARDALSGRCRVPGLVVARRVDDIAEPSDRMDARERLALAKTLESNIAPLAPHVAVLDAVRSLAEPGAFAVVTGQQPGFLASPLYSLYKALHALRLAQVLRERWSKPVVALFWNHADNHDVAEVHHSYIVNENLDLQKVSLAGFSSGRAPLSRIVLDAEEQRFSAIESLLREVTRGERHSDRAMDVFMPRDGESFARAYSRSLTELLGPLGLVVLEPDWIRESMSAALARIVEAGPAIELANGAREVSDAGYPTAIEPAGAALVYHHERPEESHAARSTGESRAERRIDDSRVTPRAEDSHVTPRADDSRATARADSSRPATRSDDSRDTPRADDSRDTPRSNESRATARSGGSRTALRAGGDGFQYDGERGSRTAAELAAEIVQAPLDWSPGALLRPIVQDECLPVAAYVGGTGELAYHAELGPLRARIGAPRTPFVPRVSCTLCDPECRNALKKRGLDVGAVLRARGVFRAEESADDTPQVAADLRAVADRAARELSALRDALSELDPSLVAQIKRTGDQVRAVVDKLAEKAERVHQNKSGKGKRHERRLANMLFPRGEPQERVLGPLPFVARFGEDWIRELLSEIDPFGGEHLVIQLGAET